MSAQPTVKAALLFATVTFQYVLLATFALLNWPAQKLILWLTPKLGSGAPTADITKYFPAGGRPN